MNALRKWRDAMIKWRDEKGMKGYDEQMKGMIWSNEGTRRENERKLLAMEGMW
jgi:hypothetical protein